MSPQVVLLTAVSSLAANKLRAGLTLLGIVIGVGAVITMIAVGSGGQAQVSERIRSLGANLLVVTPGALTEGRAVLGAGTRHTLTEDDAEAIAGEVSAVAVAAPAVVGTAQVVHGTLRTNRSNIRRSHAEEEVLQDEERL